MNKNMELTIKKFFESVYSFVNRNVKNYTETKDLSAIYDQGEVIKAQEKLVWDMVKERSQGFDAYKLNKMQWDLTTMDFPGYQAFMKPHNVDNSVLVAYREVIRGLSEYLYYGLREESFLKPLKQWNYVTSDRPLKDLIYPFLSLKHFIAKDNQRQ